MSASQFRAAKSDPPLGIVGVPEPRASSRRNDALVSSAYRRSVQRTRERYVRDNRSVDPSPSRSSHRRPAAAHLAHPIHVHDDATVDAHELPRIERRFDGRDVPRVRYRSPPACTRM